MPVNVHMGSESFPVTFDMQHTAGSGKTPALAAPADFVPKSLAQRP
jgi:hypothetical protein